MLNIKLNTQGCLTGIFILFFILLLFKLWFVIFLSIIIFLIYSKLKNVFNLKKSAEFISKPGKVYKQCAYCAAKAERAASFCSSCGKSFE